MIPRLTRSPLCQLKRPERAGPRLGLIFFKTKLAGYDGRATRDALAAGF